MNVRLGRLRSIEVGVGDFGFFGAAFLSLILAVAPSRGVLAFPNICLRTFKIPHKRLALASVALAFLTGTAPGFELPMGMLSGVLILGVISFCWAFLLLVLSFKCPEPFLRSAKRRALHEKYTSAE